MFEGFTDDRIALPSGLALRVRTAGAGPPLLLLHGYPQTHACWHLVAPRLVEAGFHVVLADLRGYGDSDRPDSDAEHTPYSKRAMARDQAALMAELGHAGYGVAGHDRGGRVGHRLARDFPDRVAALAVLDICPTEHMYAATDRAFATGYEHWFFLIQPAPLPERLIGADPDFYLDAKLAAWSGDGAVFDPEAVAKYRRAFAAPGAVHATCEDYRASAGIDLEHDAADAGRRLPMPLLALWGAEGLLDRSYDVLGVWRGYAEEVEGRALASGHFLPEEAPEETSVALADFFARHLTA